MQKKWRIVWRVTGMSLFGCVGGCAMGQAYEAPQYPQYVQYPQAAPPVTPAVPGAEVSLTDGQLDQLLGPVALYPDPLLALVFPAATYPQDVAAAGQWLASTPSPVQADIDAQGWDPSVKGLVHYPTVVKMMSDRMDWTQALGAAFLNQQPQVMASVQRLRAQAQAAQNLQTTPQAQVIVDAGAIRIEPADPSVIYVPEYDPGLVYTSQCRLSFGFGYPIGLWCDDDFDWSGNYIVIGGGWYRGWHYPPEWDRSHPGWNRRPSGGDGSGHRWARSDSGRVPRLTSSAVAHLGLNRAGAAQTANSARSIGRTPQTTAGSSRNAFSPSGTRQDVQKSVQRARPATATPAPRVAPAPRAPAQAAPRSAAPAPRAAPARSNAFSGGSGGATRSQSTRGNSSRHR